MAAQRGFALGVASRDPSTRRETSCRTSMSGTILPLGRIDLPDGVKYRAVVVRRTRSARALPLPSGMMVCNEPVAGTSGCRPEWPACGS